MPYYYQNPAQRKECGPFEERVIIARMIDGEINARTLVRPSTSEKSAAVADCDFGAVLGNLTARWRRNILGLKFESLWFYLSLLFTVTVAITYTVMVFVHPDVFADFRMFCGAAAVFLTGCVITNYFLWLYAYRMWRVVPKSRYHVTPGWRILLTYIPFFRFGWNFCMWVPLANRLRELTNYTCYTGKAAAVFYSVSNIVSSCACYALLILPWPWEVFSAPFGSYHFMLGAVLWGTFLVTLSITLISMIFMLEKLKAAALIILRRRYAYNVPMKEIHSPFMQQILQRQRRSDRRRRWAHGLGISGVLAGWPLLLIGIPVLVLSLIGSCNYEDSLRELERDGYSSGVSSGAPGERVAAGEGWKEITFRVNRDFRNFAWTRVATFCENDTLRDKVCNYALMKSPAGYFIMVDINKRLARLGNSARLGRETYDAELRRQLEEHGFTGYLKNAVNILSKYLDERREATEKP